MAKQLKNNVKKIPGKNDINEELTKLANSTESRFQEMESAFKLRVLSIEKSQSILKLKLQDIDDKQRGLESKLQSVEQTSSKFDKNDQSNVMLAEMNSEIKSLREVWNI